MVDLARGGFPADMGRAGSRPSGLDARTEEVLEAFSRYTRDHPIPVVLGALGIGFVLGWKLKPW